MKEPPTVTMQDFPIGYLEIAPENPRQSVPDAHIDRLAANIAEQGLKQNLVGYEDQDGDLTKIFITAGGCRLRALQKLDKDGDLPLAMIPVRIEPQDMAVATALSENVVRAEIGQAERVRAYKKLHEEGFSRDQIMVMYGLSAKGYANTMKIADLPEPILDALAAGEMNYEHAAGFACGDPGRALEFFEECKAKGFSTEWPKIQPHMIRSHMLKEKVGPKDRTAKFVGRKAYEKRNGIITEDLFSEDVWFDDPQLLKDMALAKLTKEAGKLRKIWAWVEPMVEAPDYQALRAYGRTYPETASGLTEAEAAEFEKLEDSDEEMSDEDYARWEDLDNRPKIETWTDAQHQIAGAIVTIDYDGKLEIEAGLIQTDDVDRAIEAGVMKKNRHMPEAGKSDDKDPLDYSASLTTDLCVDVHRSAMQCEMLEKPDKLLEILSSNLRTVLGCQRMNMSSFPTTKISDALIEQGFTPDPRMVEAWKGNVAKGGKSKAKRDATITAAIAARLEHHAGYEPKIRNWWTPTEAFFKRLTKVQLIEVICEIQAGHLRTWDTVKKGEMVEFLGAVFVDKNVHDTIAVVGSPANGKDDILVTAVKLAKTWLPPVLRPVEAEMEEAA